MRKMMSQKALEKEIDEIDTILDKHVLGIQMIGIGIRRRLQARRNGLAVELQAAFPLPPLPCDCGIVHEPNCPIAKGDSK